jgi:heme/copper-type cytochrome/quinol oxidase subunit 2
MSKNIRVSLIDPMLYQSSYINKNSTPITNNFWKKFNLLNFIINILLPVAVIIFVLFVLKARYQKKQNDKSSSGTDWNGGTAWNGGPAWNSQASYSRKY